MTATALLLAGAQLVAAQQIDTLALRAHTRFLAADALEGRGVGSDGERIAALYIESQLRRIGVRTAPGANGYVQPLPLRKAVIDSAVMVVHQTTDSARFGASEFLLNTGGERALRSFAGSAVFLGTAEHALAADDHQLAGKVIVLLGTLGVDAAILVPRWLAAGVRGAVVLVPDSAQFQLFVRSRGHERYFVAGDMNEPIWQSSLPTVLGGPAVTRALTPAIADLFNRLTRTAQVTPVTLEKEIAVSIQATVETITSQNLIGIIPGRDPALAKEFVMFTAHYDHLGISTPGPRGDSIYNGFSDNAAGVAMVLAIAEALVRAPPARSTAFLFVSAEERGLLGSTFYTAQPVLPLAQTVAVINLDAGAPPAPPIEWRLAGGANSTLGTLSEQIVKRHGWKLELGLAAPNSDYWPFHTRGVPAVFLIPGPTWEGLSPRERDALRARWDRYHRADDEWAEDFPFRGLQRYAQLALEIGTAAANAAARPTLIRR